MADFDLLHPDTETLAPREMRLVQERKWARQRGYLAASSGFYRDKLGDTIDHPITLEKLQDVPLTEKDELKASQEAEPPYGAYVACDLDRIVRVHNTSGTTGRALILAMTKTDARIIAEQGSRGIHASGLRPGDRVVHCLNYCLWTGGLTDHMTLEATGATVIPFGVGNTRHLIETILDLGVTAISCTPSYPALIEQVLREEFSKSPRELGLRLALFGGEPGLDNAEFRAELERRWGFQVRNANYGMSEVMSIMGSQCEAGNDLHFLSSDVVYPELLDPATGRRLDIEDGATGELVCTHLEKQCQPLVRYRTRDVLTVTGAEPCACGRTSFRFRVTGRSDDMFNVRGINIFPTALQEIVAANAAVASGHFRILLEGPGPYDVIRLKVEAAESLGWPKWENAARAIETAIKHKTGASAEVELVAFEHFPRTGGKTALIERL